MTIGNLETTFAGGDKGFSSYPMFNTPDELATNLKSIGVDVLTTANNHCLDYGYDGLTRTIDVLDKADVSHLGTYKSQKDRDSVFIKFVKGVKIAFVNYTYGTNDIDIPSEKSYCVNLIDKELILKDLEAAKDEEPDLIVACMHWGQEYQPVPNSEQTDLSDFLFKNGVDVILGNHPHVLQKMEKKTVTLDDGSEKECFVVYSLGNFIGDQDKDNTRNSAILNLKLTRQSDGKITVDGADYVPIYMFKDPSVSTHKFKLYDIERSLEAYDAGDLSLSEDYYKLFTKELESVKSALGDPIS